MGENKLLIESKHQPLFRKTKDLCGIKEDKALNIHFWLYQEIEQNYAVDTIQVDKIAKSMTEGVDRFATETFLAKKKMKHNGSRTK